MNRFSLGAMKPCATISWGIFSAVLAGGGVCAGEVQGEKLKAYYFEVADRYTGKVGLGEWLKWAGFEVLPLPLDRPPYEKGGDPEKDVDLIAFGSFASTSPEYVEFMKRYGSELDDYIDRCGLLVQFAQADQDERVPPFLPDTQEASRSDLDFPRSLVLAPGHLLLEGMPVSLDRRELSFPLSAGDAWYRRNVQWESFDRFAGFQVLLAGDEQARAPGMMEGAYGQGRFILSALALDKWKKPDGSDEAPEAMKKVAEPFFRNLYSYARLVKHRKTAALELTPPPGASQVKEGAWTLVLLPDTQIYSQNFPGIFESQTSWIWKQARARNIRYVLHLGDIVNVNSVVEWENARRAMATLDGRVPYAMVPGNHDYGPGGNAATRESFLNEFFLESDYRGRPGFGGVMEEGKMDNSYHLFEAGGVEWIVICLEWGPRPTTVEWANRVMKEHAGRKGILVTHAYMNHNDQRYDHKSTEYPQAYNPHHYQTPGGVSDGEELWNQLVRRHDFVLTFNGHVLNDGTGYRVDVNDHGSMVHQMLVNYQFRELGGQGYLRLIEFQPDGKTVRVKSYSPIFDRYLLEADQDFSFTLDLQPADRDGDGIFDYYDPDLDDDGDGLNHWEEFVIYGTSSSNRDSDGDGLGDGEEVDAGTDPMADERKSFEAVKKHARVFGLEVKREDERQGE